MVLMKYSSSVQHLVNQHVKIEIHHALKALFRDATVKTGSLETKIINAFRSTIVVRLLYTIIWKIRLVLSEFIRWIVISIAKPCTGENEEYTDCGGCDPTCDAPDLKCKIACQKGCFCKKGFVRDSNNKCIDPKMCRKFENLKY